MTKKDNKPYIAIPKHINGADDLEELTVMKNKYADELDLPPYIALNCDIDAVPDALHNSCTTMRWFCENIDERETPIGMGYTIDEAVQNLIRNL